MNSFEELRGKKVALMGGAGFIGHNLALELKKLGAEPHVVDGLQVNSLGYYTSGYDSNPMSELYISFINERLRLLREAGVGLHVIDIRDYHIVSRTINNIQPDVVIHLAAVAHADRSNKDPFSTFDHSLRTLENVLDVISDQNIHLIYFSSSMVYGHFGGKWVTEETPCNPLGIYGTLKYSGELIVKAYHRVFNIPYTIIRPSALYGERCVSGRVSQIFIEKAMQGLDITINGDGSDKLDFTYIDDLVQGVVLVIEKEKARNETFNLTYGNSRSIGEMAEILKDYFKGININYNPKDSLTPDRDTLNVDKARNLLGYDPQNPIDVGYPKYIQWYKTFWDLLKK